MEIESDSEEFIIDKPLKFTNHSGSSDQYLVRTQDSLLKLNPDMTFEFTEIQSDYDFTYKTDFGNSVTHSYSGTFYFQGIDSTFIFNVTQFKSIRGQCITEKLVDFVFTGEKLNYSTQTGYKKMKGGESIKIEEVEEFEKKRPLLHMYVNLLKDK